MKKNLPNLILALALMLNAEAANGQDAGTVAPLQGRVETIQFGGDPILPAEILQGSLNSSATEASLPLALKGRWYGTVQITQMDTYPSLHPEPYCQAFIREIVSCFHQGQKGQLVFEMRPADNNSVTLISSDVCFAHGLRVQLTSAPGPALVRGGTNLPRTVRNDVIQLDADRVEQSRFDYVTIVDQFRQPLHFGFSEVSALYRLIGPRRIAIKLLSVDYDQNGKPLWKSLMEGNASR